MKIIILCFIISLVTCISVYSQPTDNGETKKEENKHNWLDDILKKYEKIFATNGKWDTIFVNEKNGENCELSFSFINGSKKAIFYCGENKILLYNPVKEIGERLGGKLYRITSVTDGVSDIDAGYIYYDKGSVWNSLYSKICSEK